MQLLTKKETKSTTIKTAAKRYITYCSELPKTLSQSKIKPAESFIGTKPRGGLWGCHGNEWKEWCKCEEFNLSGLKHHFYFKLSKDARLLILDTEEDLVNFILGFPLCNYGTALDYSKVMEKYDAIEITDNLLNECRLGIQHRRLPKEYRYFQFMGVNGWDVPSICVLNPNVVEFCDSRGKVLV